MGWNYRVLEKIDTKRNTSYYEVCEVYYDEEGTPHSWTETHNLLVGSDLEDLRWAYEKINEAFNKPVLKCINEKYLEVS